MWGIRVLQSTLIHSHHKISAFMRISSSPMPNLWQTRTFRFISEFHRRQLIRYTPCQMSDRSRRPPNSKPSVSRHARDSSPSASIDPRDQELRRRALRLVAIGQVCRKHQQGASADSVPEGAIDLEAARGVVGDLAIVLLVLSVAEQHDALDLLADGGAAVADGGRGESRALAVVTVSTKLLCV